MLSKQRKPFMPGTRDQFLAFPTFLRRLVPPLLHWEAAMKHAQVIFIDLD
jgi:hypothetical protein